MNQEKIGKFIAEKRKDANLTQEELAKKLGITKNAVSKWERGISLMDMSLLKPLSEELHVSINEILAGEMISDKDIREVADKNILEFDKLNKMCDIKMPFIIFIIYMIMVIIIGVTLSYVNEFFVQLYAIETCCWAMLYGTLTLFISFGHHVVSTIFKKDKFTLILTIICGAIAIIDFVIYLVDFCIAVF